MTKKEISIIQHKYLDQIKNAPILSLEQEQQLAENWVKKQDQKAANQLVISHLRLVYKIASEYKNYGIPIYELFSEGTIGLVHAVKKFDPKKGVRLSTYAMLWIKAAIQEYILKSWSLVKIGSSALHKKLFFNLRRLKHEMNVQPNIELTSSQVQLIADTLGVQARDVINMNNRITLTDQSLNAQIIKDSPEEKINLIKDEQLIEEEILNLDELNYYKKLIFNILSQFPERERNIFIARYMLPEVITLNELSKQYNISQERVRQIEAEAFKKIYNQIQIRYLLPNNKLLK